MRARKTAHELIGAKVEAIHPDAIYHLADLPRVLRIGRDSIEAEVKSGRLVHGEVAGRFVFRGLWLLAWIESKKVGP